MINQISDQLNANIIGKLTYLPQCMGMKVSSTKDVILVNTEIPCDMFNVACLMNSAADLKSIANSFHNLPFAWWVGFGNDCAKYKQKLEKFGVKNPEIESGMYADIEKISRISDCKILHISQVTDLISLRDFIEVYKQIIPTDENSVEKFYLSSAPFICEKQSLLKLFVGYVNHRPVATGALFLQENIAGVWDITTLSDFRNLGIATNMTYHMLSYAHNLYNCKIGVLTATKSGEKVYRKIGFRKIKEFFVFNIFPQKLHLTRKNIATSNRE
ncbi:MAG: GNAT family N-acetyltransferase [Alphaproteobacteria bacterium]|nr:GNAT family N-acetyltransferase [Alphaproteobacteria bacterium]